MDRIFFDSNTGDSAQGYILDFEKSKEDILKIGDRAHEGMIVLLYMSDELEVEAELKFDTTLNCWVGVPKGPFKLID